MGQAGTDAHVISVPPGQMEKHYSSAHDYLNATYGNQDTAWVAKNAPFGTNHTQLQRVRIVGGQRLLVKEDPNWTEKARNAVNTLHPCSPIARTWSKQLNNERRPPSPPTIPENINNLDYTDYLQQRSRDCQSHGDASALKEQISYRKKKYICQRTQPQEPDTTSDILNPHPVLPPIDDTVSIDSAEYLARYIPPGCDLASQPIALSKQDELLLKQRIARGLGCDFNRNRLKEVYNELVEYDEGLTGYVEYTNIGYALQRSQVHLAGTDLRLLCSMYVCRLEPRKVNYEKVLTFIAACYSSAGPGDGRDWQDSGASLTSGKVISEDASSRGSGSQKRDSDDLSLVKLMFENADVHKRGTLTREQIRVLSFAAGFNVKEHEIDQIMSKYERGSFPGAYNWQPYLADVTGRCGWNSKATLISPRNTSMKSLKSDQRSTRSDKQDTSSEMSRDRKHGSKSTESTPWFDRFMKMAKAFYLVDAENTGSESCICGRPLVSKQMDNGTQVVSSQPASNTQVVSKHPTSGTKMSSKQPSSDTKVVIKQPPTSDKKRPTNGKQMNGKQPNKRMQMGSKQEENDKQMVSKQPNQGMKMVGKQPTNDTKMVSKNPNMGMQMVATQPTDDMQIDNENPAYDMLMVSKQPSDDALMASQQPTTNTQEDGKKALKHAQMVMQVVKKKSAKDKHTTDDTDMVSPHPKNKHDNMQNASNHPAKDLDMGGKETTDDTDMVNQHPTNDVQMASKQLKRDKKMGNKNTQNVSKKTEKDTKQTTDDIQTVSKPSTSDTQMVMNQPTNKHDNMQKASNHPPKKDLHKVGKETTDDTQMVINQPTNKHDNTQKASNHPPKKDLQKVGKETTDDSDMVNQHPTNDVQMTSKQPKRDKKMGNKNMQNVSKKTEKDTHTVGKQTTADIQTVSEPSTSDTQMVSNQPTNKPRNGLRRVSKHPAMKSIKPLAKDKDVVQKQSTSDHPPKNLQTEATINKQIVDEQLTNDEHLIREHATAIVETVYANVISEQPTSGNTHMVGELPTSGPHAIGEQPASGAHEIVEQPTDSAHVVFKQPASGLHVFFEEPASGADVVGEQPTSGNQVDNSQ